VQYASVLSQYVIASVGCTQPDSIQVGTRCGVAGTLVDHCGGRTDQYQSVPLSGGRIGAAHSVSCQACSIVYSSLQRSTHPYQYCGAIQCSTSQYCVPGTDLYVAGNRIYVGTDAYVSVHIFTLWYGTSRANPCWHRPGVVKGTCLYSKPNQVIYLQPIGVPHSVQ